MCVCAYICMCFSNNLKNIYFSWRTIFLQHCGGPCHTSTWISHRRICAPHPETPSHHPPHPIPLCCPRALALSALLHSSNLHWSSVLHLVIHMFQCYSLISSQPHLLPHSPTVCSLHLCLFCLCVWDHCYCLSKFHIYVLIYYTGVL